MRAIVDTNVLVRGAVGDDPAQSRQAARLLQDAAEIIVTLPTACEFAWVLRARYGFTGEGIALALERLLASPKVTVNRPAVEAGLAMVRAGGDFADGVIAHEGRWLGGDVFVSFDRQAVRLLNAQGYRTHRLG